MWDSSSRWLLPYLRTHFNLGAQQAGAWASIPLYAGASATWISGMAVDALYRHGHRSLSRRLPAMCGFGLAAIMLLIASHVDSVGAFVACFAVTTFGVDFTLSPSWSVSSDIGGPRTGTLSAAMNTLGSLGSFASSVAFPMLLAWTGSIKAHFLVAAAFDVAAVFCWWRMRPYSGETS